MAMNFWEAQRKARSRTTLYLFIFILMCLVVSVGVELAFRAFGADEDYNAQPMPFFGLTYLGLTFIIAGYNYYMYTSQGGSVVAESCDGVLVDPDTQNPKEKQLINIVEEMAIAASLPVPLIYVIPVNSINAFAAGTKPQNAAIAVTRGSLNILNRDELQGVIAHEFGHIYNGDMIVSMRLAAMTMGFFCILYIGLRILQFSSFSDRDSRNKKDNGNNGNAVAVAALIFIIAGAFTWLFGSVLKCCVSREKEYLADACAVQFTRNPEGIANALRKIGAEESTNMPAHGTAFSHMYLDDHTALGSIFATHPPLDRRIAAIEGEEYKPAEDLTKIPPKQN